VAATVPSESEFQSWTIFWRNTFLRISSQLWRMSNLSLCPLVHLPSALKKNISGSSQSNPFVILNTWIIFPRRRLKSSDGNLRACSLSSYDRCLEDFAVIYIKLHLPLTWSIHVLDHSVPWFIITKWNKLINYPLLYF